MPEDNPVLRLIEKAKTETPTTPRLKKLFARIREDEDLFLIAYELLKDLFWSCEAFTAGLSPSEIKFLASFLESKKILGIQLPSSADYRAVLVAAEEECLKGFRRGYNQQKHQIEQKLSVLLRFSSQGTVVSGYKMGYPLTAYLGKDSHRFTIYDNATGKFIGSENAFELELKRDNPLFLMAASIERSLGELEELAKTWKFLELGELRLKNLKNFGDARGAFA